MMAYVQPQTQALRSDPGNTHSSGIHLTSAVSTVNGVMWRLCYTCNQEGMRTLSLLCLWQTTFQVSCENNNSSMYTCGFMKASLESNIIYWLACALTIPEDCYCKRSCPCLAPFGGAKKYVYDTIFKQSEGRVFRRSAIWVTTVSVVRPFLLREVNYTE